MRSPLDKVIEVAVHHAMCDQQRLIPRSFVARLVRLAVAVPAKLAAVANRKVICPRIRRALLDHLAHRVRIAGVIHPVHHHLGYRNLPNEGLVTGLVVDVEG